MSGFDPAFEGTGNGFGSIVVAEIDGCGSAFDGTPGNGFCSIFVCEIDGFSSAFEGTGNGL